MSSKKLVTSFPSSRNLQTKDTNVHDVAYRVVSPQPAPSHYPVPVSYGETQDFSPQAPESFGADISRVEKGGR